MLPRGSPSHSNCASRNDQHSAAVNELGFSTWTYHQDLLVDVPSRTFSTEVKILTDKLKEIENYFQSVPEVMSHGHQAGNSALQNLPHSYIAPYQQHSDYGSIPQSSDRAVLELFHRIPSQPNYGEKWSLLQIPQMLEEMLHQICTLQRKLIQEEILVWKREHQLAKNGFKQFSKNLNDIQTSCEELLDSHIALHKNFELLYQTNNAALSHTYQTLKSRAVALLSEFLNSTLIVECDPSQVIKINTRFAHPVVLRHLLGQKLYSKPHYNCIKANIISESTARELIQDTNTNRAVCKGLSSNLLKSSGVILNGSAKMEIVDRKYVGHFKNLQLRKIDRKSKKVKGMNHNASPTGSKMPRTSNSHRHEHSPSDVEDMDSSSQQETTKEILSSTVTDEKFCLHFHTEIRCCSIDFNVSTLSCPVTVVTHGIQEPQAQASIAWDNAFGCVKDPTNPLVDRIPFTVPVKVSWESLAEMLSVKFEQATEKGLEPFQLEALKYKLLPEVQYHSATAALDGSAVHEISFNRFSKSTLSGCPFSFWEWFYSSMKLIEKHALRSWKSGAIYGFISRKDAEIMLHGSSPGVFLVRFSDTVLGGISITFVSRDGQVHSITPLTSKNLSFRSLSDSIWDLETLTHVYPTIPKAKVFPQPSRSCFPQPNNSDLTVHPKNVGQTEESQRQRFAMNYRLSNYVMCVPKITLPPQCS